MDLPAVSPPTPPKPHELAARGWSGRLTIFVCSLLVIQAVTGLCIWLAPFSRSSQVQLLLHVVSGLLVTIPFIVFQVRHLIVWAGQRLTAVSVLGYLLLGMVLVCGTSGVVLSWEAGFERRLSPTWDVVHLVSGMGTAVLLAVHLVAAYARRRASLTTDPRLRLAVRRFMLGSMGLVGSAMALVIGLSLIWRAEPVEFPVPEGYQLSEYLESFDEYRGSPFAPTYARTESGNMVDPSVLSGSESCGTVGCHEQILEEWLPSAHRFSAMNPPFQAVQKNFAADRDPVETRYCAGCHDPISLFAGAKDLHNVDLAAPGMQEGCSCVVCHSISKVDQRGNADYVLTPPQKYLWEGETGWKKIVSDFLIRAYPRQHLADYDRNILRSPEFCGTCHKQFIPEALNRFGMSPGQNQYDEWRKSHWHSDDPQSDLSCRDCHMRLVSDSTDPGRGEGGDARRSPDDGAHRHHGTIATNFFIPGLMKLRHWERHVELTEEWMRGETELPEIAHLWPSGPVASLELIAPETAEPGQKVSIRAVTTNRKAGHNFITGPLDFVRAWIHLRIVDADGESIHEWGAIDPETRRITDTEGVEHETGNSRKEGTMVLEATPLDAEGNELVRHELWKKAGGKGERVIFPRYSDTQVFSFVVPADAKGELRVEADLQFRRYRQEFLDLVLPGIEENAGFLQPTVTQASASRVVRIGTVETSARLDGNASPSR